MSDHPILMADIGGTNARFAFTSTQPPFFNQAQSLSCADHVTIEDAIDTYLQTHDVKQIKAISFAVAGPIINETVNFTNNHWSISCSDLRAKYLIDQAYLLNDFEAIAYSLAELGDQDTLDVGGQWKKIAGDDFTVSVIGPGSGLGVAGLCQRNAKLFPLVTEGGHAGFAPENSMQHEILVYLHKKFADRVSRERLLSGPGLVNLHEALCHIFDQENPALAAADIANAAVNGSDDMCVKSLDTFFEILGQLAGDTALATGSTDGVFIGGGIAQRYPEYLANSNFREGFENKGRYRALLEKVPTWLITHKNPGLLGASIYARDLIA